MFRPCTRYNSLVSHPDQIPVKLFNAVMQAQRAPSGPSHLSIPVDILRHPMAPETEVPDFAGLLRWTPALVDVAAVEQLARLVSEARRPVWLIGDGCGEAGSELMRLVQITEGSFVTTPDGKGFVNPRHPRFKGVFGFGGHGSAAELLASEPDLVIALGTGFGEFNSGGWSSALLNSRLVHVDDSDENLMRSPMARLHVRGHIRSVCEQLLRLLDAPQEGALLPFQHPQKAQDAYDAMVDEPDAARQPCSPVKPQRLLATLGERCPPHPALWPTPATAPPGPCTTWPPAGPPQRPPAAQHLPAHRPGSAAAVPAGCASPWTLPPWAGPSARPSASPWPTAAARWSASHR